MWKYGSCFEKPLLYFQVVYIFWRNAYVHAGALLDNRFPERYLGALQEPLILGQAEIRPDYDQYDVHFLWYFW